MQKNYLKIYWLFSFNVLILNLIAQTDSVNTGRSFVVSGYLEAYYIYDFNAPAHHNRPPFVYSFHRHNEVNLNLGLIKLAYQTEKLRGNFALMSGTYANANLAAEEGVLKHIFEANIGVKISKQHNLWVDAGVFSSHIGFESAIGKDCWNLTRGILADNSPYYESGVKLNYNSADNQWFMSALVLNGWQRIQRVAGNNTPCVGHQLTYKPTENWVFNSSSFIGNDKPDSVRQMRYFHDFYAQYLQEKWGVTFGFDIGIEQKSYKNTRYNRWYTPILIVRYSPAPRWCLAARWEHYNDPNGVIIAFATPNGFQTSGYSLNVDYKISMQALWRVEIRRFDSRDAIFERGAKFSRSNTFVATSLSLSL